MRTTHPISMCSVSHQLVHFLFEQYNNNREFFCNHFSYPSSAPSFYCLLFYLGRIGCMQHIVRKLYFWSHPETLVETMKWNHFWSVFHCKVEKIEEHSLDSIPLNENSNYWRESLFEVIKQNIAGWSQQTFCSQMFVGISQQCFAFTP